MDRRPGRRRRRRPRRGRRDGRRRPRPCRGLATARPTSGRCPRAASPSPYIAAMPGAEPSILDVATAADWERWLDQHHADTDEGVWLVLRNKAARTDASLTYVEAVEVALCFGWID